MARGNPNPGNNSYTFEVKANPLAWGFVSADRGISDAPGPSMPDLDIIFSGANTGPAEMARFNAAVIGEVTSFAGTYFADILEKDVRRRREDKDTRNRSNIYVILRNEQEVEIRDLLDDVRADIATDIQEAEQAIAERALRIIAIGDEVGALRADLEAIYAQREDTLRSILYKSYMQENDPENAALLLEKDANGNYVIDADQLIEVVSIMNEQNKLVDFAASRTASDTGTEGTDAPSADVPGDRRELVLKDGLSDDISIVHDGVTLDRFGIQEELNTTALRMQKIQEMLNASNEDLIALVAQKETMDALSPETQLIVTQIAQLEAERASLIAMQSDALLYLEGLNTLGRAMNDPEKSAAFSEALQAFTSQNGEIETLFDDELTSLMAALGVPSHLNIPQDEQERAELLGVLGLEDDATNFEIAESIKQFERTLARQLNQQGIEAYSAQYTMDDAIRDQNGSDALSRSEDLFVDNAELARPSENAGFQTVGFGSSVNGRAANIVGDEGFAGSDTFYARPMQNPIDNDGF